MQGQTWKKVGMLWLVLVLFSACTRPQGKDTTSPGASGAEQWTGGAASLCAQWPPELPLDWQAAANLPTVDDQGQLRRFEEVQRHPWMDYVAQHGFCQVALPASAADLLDRARALIAEGKSDEALQLLETLLRNPLGRYSGRHGLSIPVKEDASGEQVRPSVRTLLEAATAASQAGDPDWERYWRAAQDVYREYIVAHLDEIEDVREALVVTHEIDLLLDDKELFQEAWNQVVALVEKALRDQTKAFDPCTADRDQIQALLEAMQGADLVGANTEAFNAALQKVAVAIRRNGGDPSLIMTDPPAPHCPLQIAWEHTYAGGMTVVGEAHTCDGVAWEGTFQMSGRIEGMALYSEGTLAWSVEPGEMVETRAPSAGTLKSPDFSAPFTDELYLRFTLGEDTQSAELLLTSDGNGTIILPVVGAGSFASVFPGEPVTVSPQPYAACENAP